MLAAMKRKAIEASAAEESNGPSETAIEFRELPGKPMYNSVSRKLITTLKPIKFTLTDDSAGHAGHAGREGFTNPESHFSLKIVADCFGSLSLVQRHKLIYTLLADEMQQIHALQIDAKSPQEVGL